MVAIKDKSPFVPDAIGEFIDGALRGSRGGGSTAALLGDLAGSFVPGLSELNSARDFWDGLHHRDPARLISGAIGLIPVVGEVSKGTGAISTLVSRELGQKGLTAGTMQLTRLLGEGAQQFATKAMADPKFKEKLALAQAKIFEHVAAHAVEQLGANWQGSVRDHASDPKRENNQASFSHAQKLLFDALGCKPDPTWHSVRGEDGKVSGKHKLGPANALEELFSMMGFRFVAPDPNQPDHHGLMWWRQPTRDDKPEVGIETFRASPGERERIESAYLSQVRKFRARRAADAA